MLREFVERKSYYPRFRIAGAPLGEIAMGALSGGLGHRL